MSVSPAAPPSNQALVSFEIKSAQLPLVALLLKTTDWDLLAADLLRQFGPEGENPAFFDHDPLVLDFSPLPTDSPVQDLKPLLQTLRACCLVAVAVRGASAVWMQAALAVGLVEAPLDLPRVRPVPVEALPQPVATQERRALPGAATLVIDKPLRSGQKIYARGADLVVLAMVNQGAEVVADGNIHVYAPLRGKAMAGASGNTQARIFSLCLEPELISIAGVYRTSENPLAADIQGKPAQVRLSDDGQDKLLFEALNP
ncbi:MAG: septum site-determining protein MinC [Gammaproteobacteria bacterium]|uniref:septum site-determining protein MinC n=1 Tax=Rhodoferax sp. TaxID=50421 RepID=UPI0017A6847A|nr:septum site-determining protein MinC [Rhodoferax sp.]MBU3900828.1 septum site-determining protein MinC [Gammaproteobacteria bacterium]MBA3060019.1 septum site-determining protein MinC [Rhodoferax sp.]MBU3996590.1 septum site-determining protein MinC [Gammaproteobacteria bacterium]MBU4079579.1 septum site-determining protein MinC [Gammaproteobacteria bacterium]MBU4112243.1 septum site-determining protein MinC [Gammaproteobacteria bacterium]